MRLRRRECLKAGLLAGLTGSCAGVYAARCLRNRATAIVLQASRIAEVRKNGAPIRQSFAGRCETKPSSGAPIIGASTDARLPSAATEPIVWPCVFSPAAADTRLWIVGTTA